MKIPTKFDLAQWLQRKRLKSDNIILTPLDLLFLLCISDQQKNNFLEDHPMNIPTKFGSNWPSGFREDD